MALTHERVQEMARQAKMLADQTKALNTLLKEFLATNSNLAIDWGAQSKPAYIIEDVAGNIYGDGLYFSRQAVANVIGSFSAVVNILGNVAVSQGDYMGNVNVVATSSVTVQK
jgi:hypothetical protein